MKKNKLLLAIIATAAIVGLSSCTEPTTKAIEQTPDPTTCAELLPQLADAESAQFAPELWKSNTEADREVRSKLIARYSHLSAVKVALGCKTDSELRAENAIKMFEDLKK